MVPGHFWTVLPATPTPKHDEKNVLESIFLSDVFSYTPFILISTAAQPLLQHSLPGSLCLPYPFPRESQYGLFSPFCLFPPGMVPHQG